MHSPRERPILSLYGAFKELKELTTILTHDIILGYTLDGKNVTLYNCHESRTQMSAGLTSEYSVSYVIVGYHFLNEEQIKFSRISINYTYFDEWINKHGFFQNFIDNELIIKYKQPDEIIFDINETFQLKFDIKGLMEPISFWKKESLIKQQTRAQLISKKGDVQFSVFLDSIYLLQNFLSLAVLEPVYPIELIAEIDDVRVELPNGQSFPQPIDIYYKIDPFMEKKTLHPAHFLFLFEDEEKHIDKYLKNWFKKSDLLKPVIDLYFSLYYNPRMYMQTKFINSLLALEAYHRRTRNNYMIPKKEYRELSKKILINIPDKYREKMKGKLIYGNEPSLKDRLIGIIKDLHIILDDIIDDIDDFVKDIMNTRNYLIHYDRKKKKTAASGVRLYILTRKIMLMLHILLLIEIGMKKREIQTLIEKNDTLSLKNLQQ